ncbi:MAG: S1C family serine protease [Pyrinomonadaceae bacterium]
MLSKLRNKCFGVMLTLLMACFTASAQYVYSTAGHENAAETVVTILLSSDGEAHAVGSGLVVRADGYVMTPYSLVKGAREIQVRFRNGETYDKAEIVSTDERRNIALLRIKAAGLRIIPHGTVEETQVGSRVLLFANPDGQFVSKNDLTLSSVQMADTVQGAGKGYRVLQIDSTVAGNTAGALLLDERGYSLGMITTSTGMKGQIAVPLSSVVGLIRSVQTNSVITTTPVSNPSTSQTPFPIPQGSVLVPERGVTPLSAKGPGSVVVKPRSVPDVLAVSKTIYVTSRTISFKPDQMVNALNSRKEMAEWGYTFVDERELADLILEIDHVLYTWKYTFKLYSQRLSTVVATGSRIIWDGNLGAPYMADRFIEKVKVARGPEKKPTTTEKETKKAEENKKEN